MYTYEQRMAAVKLYIQYYHKAAAVIRELGYPNRHMLVKWGSKDMNPLGICIRRVVVKENRSFLTNKNKLRYSFIRGMAAVSP